MLNIVVADIFHNKKTWVKSAQPTFT